MHDILSRIIIRAVSSAARLAPRRARARIALSPTGVRACVRLPFALLPFIVRIEARHDEERAAM